MTHALVLLSLTALVVFGACHIIRMLIGAYQTGAQWASDERVQP